MLFGSESGTEHCRAYLHDLWLPRSVRTLFNTYTALQTKDQKSAIETAIDSAKETCESGSAGACATAWDEVCRKSSCYKLKLQEAFRALNFTVAVVIRFLAITGRGAVSQCC